MPRQRRSDLPDGVYHVTARGVARELIFIDDDDRRAFLRLLADAVARQQWHTHAFCLLGTHYHLIVSTTRARLSKGLHRLNTIYAQHFNRRHGRRGHVFGDRFASWVIDEDEHLAAACLYVLENPVRAGLCERAEDWRWSGVKNVRSIL
ncbi:MAG TPA: transposase [Gemmatimonadaceae bacterium]|nr:transposase [Gemmatimonadaceae bacterium]